MLAHVAGTAKKVNWTMVSIRVFAFVIEEKIVLES
tara:strand:- start:169 stop:273 length:105 start_codon:yes stop_codon:yes gene_type:complete